MRSAFGSGARAIQFTMVAAIALMLGPRSVQAQDPQFTFTKIADTVDDPGLGNTFCVGLSDTGTVVVAFVPQGSSVLQAWLGHGQAFTQLPNSNVHSLCPSINGFDDVAYIDVRSATDLRLVKNVAGSVTTLATYPSYDFSGGNYRTPLNNSGHAAFQSQINPSTGTAGGIFVAPAGTAVYNQATDPAFGFWQLGDMNDSDTVVFVASRPDATFPGGARVGIYRDALTPLIEDGAQILGGTLSVPFQRPVINASGRVAFFGSAGSSNVYTTVDGISVDVVGTGPLGDRVSINDAGVVAFTRGNSTFQGIYIGSPQAPDRKVIGNGDPLDGSTYLAGFIWEEAINNKGQIAFHALLADGRRGVYRADPANRAPVAEDDSLTTNEDTPASGTLTASDADNDALTYSIVSNGGKGTAAIINAATGAFTYTPNANANGNDSFSFKGNDGQVDSTPATISVAITPVNDAPEAFDNTASVNAGGSTTGVLAATDVDSVTVTRAIVTDGSKGTAVITDAATGAYTYTSTPGTSGTDSFTFQASDGQAVSNIATVVVTIQSTPPADPVFSGFLAPVAGAPSTNVAKAGQVIAVKFRLGGEFGLDIFEPGSPASQPTDCTPSASSSTVTETVTAGKSSLTYDAATQTYVYGWKTDKGWAGTCRRLTLTFSDSRLTPETAQFKFVK